MPLPRTIWLLALLAISVGASAPAQQAAIPLQPEIKLKHCSRRVALSSVARTLNASDYSDDAPVVVIEAEVLSHGCTGAVWIIRKLRPDLDRKARAEVASWRLPMPRRNQWKRTRYRARFELRFNPDGSLPDYTVMGRRR